MITRREFLKRTGQASAAVAVGVTIPAKADAYVVTQNYHEGMVVKFNPKASNTGPSYWNEDALRKWAEDMGPTALKGLRGELT